MAKKDAREEERLENIDLNRDIWGDGYKIVIKAIKNIVPYDIPDRKAMEAVKIFHSHGERHIIIEKSAYNSNIHGRRAKKGRHYHENRAGSRFRWNPSGSYKGSREIIWWLAPRSDESASKDSKIFTSNARLLMLRRYFPGIPGIYIDN
ncbi:hypothetical protein QE152_g13406 [Popillia japonica]|uniref:Uncharacterized protein n=1 Tax=Popillia japonica TaxID=7064 RepID=A0AAW1LDT0_POPJA